MAIEDEIRKIAGDIGIKIFRAANGSTIWEIAKSVGVGQEEVMEVVEKMKNKFISIELPKKEVEEIVIEKKEREEVPIDVPQKIKLDKFSELKLISELTFSYGPSAKKIYETIDGIADVTQIAVSASVTLDYVDEVCWILAEKRRALFKRLTQKEIKERYGGIGLKIYEKSSRDGIYLYLLLEKYGDHIAAIRAFGDPEKGVEIYSFIHKLLSPPFKFDKDETFAAIAKLQK